MATHSVENVEAWFDTFTGPEWGVILGAMGCGHMPTWREREGERETTPADRQLLSCLAEGKTCGGNSVHVITHTLSISLNVYKKQLKMSANIS